MLSRPLSAAPSPLAVTYRLPRAAAPTIHVEEAVHVAYCERRGRLLWEAAVFTLQAVCVDEAGAARRYAPGDPWTERAEDPRLAYHAVGPILVRRAEPGRDYDEARHLAEGVEGGPGQ